MAKHTVVLLYYGKLLKLKGKCEYSQKHDLISTH